MGTGGNENNQREWGGNCHKMRLNLGSEMRIGMSHSKWEGMERKGQERKSIYMTPLYIV